jgi:hypothetical protein
MGIRKAGVVQRTRLSNSLASRERTMTPYDLLGLVAIILVSRIALSIRPVTAALERTQRRNRARVSRPVHLSPASPRGCSSRSWRVRTTFRRDRCCRRSKLHDVLLVDKFEYRFPPPERGRHRRLPAADPDAGRLHQARDRTPRRHAQRIKAATSTSTGKRSTSRILPKSPSYELDIHNYAYLRELRFGLAETRCVASQHSAEIRSGLAPDTHPAALLRHDGRQSQRFGRLARLGIRAGRGHIRGRAASGRACRIYRPRLPDLLAAQPAS